MKITECSPVHFVKFQSCSWCIIADHLSYAEIHKPSFFYLSPFASTFIPLLALMPDINKNNSNFRSAMRSNYSAAVCICPAKMVFSSRKVHLRDISSAENYRLKANVDILWTFVIINYPREALYRCCVRQHFYHILLKLWGCASFKINGIVEKMSFTIHYRSNTEALRYIPNKYA